VYAVDPLSALGGFMQVFLHPARSVNDPAQKLILGECDHPGTTAGPVFEQTWHALASYVSAGALNKS
jgi:hypothetical protein